MGEGVGVGVKGVEARVNLGGGWSWKHNKKHHNVLVDISSCRWECNYRSWVCHVKGLEKLVVEHE
jgi:hypothetical protein